MAECTIVSAFIANVNTRSDRDIQKYLDYGRALMSVRIRQIIFIERGGGRGGFAPFATPGRKIYGEDGTLLGYEYFFEGGSAPSATVLFFEKSDMYFNDLRDSITEFSVDTQHPHKDTLDYMFVQCHKTEWVAKAIEFDKTRLGGSAPGMYVWLDFGIRHMFRSDISFEVELYRMRDRCLAFLEKDSGAEKGTEKGTEKGAEKGTETDVVYAAGCWNPKCVYYQDIYRQIHWIFAGSVFAGKADALLEFAQRTKEKCLSIITQKRRLMWEVNVWYLVYLDKRSLFSFYRADHNASILSGLFS